jgi:hypothetical protein
MRKESIMADSSVSQSNQQFNVIALGWGLSAALVVLYIVCWVAVFLFPGLAHGWLALFSTTPAGSISGLVAGVLWSVVMGWITACVLGFVYNKLASR